MIAKIRSLRISTTLLSGMICFPRFRFRLVHLFVLLTIVCVVCGVIAPDVYVTNRVISRVDELGGIVYREPTFVGSMLEYISVDGGVVIDGRRVSWPNYCCRRAELYV